MQTKLIELLVYKISPERWRPCGAKVARCTSNASVAGSSPVMVKIFVSPNEEDWHMPFLFHHEFKPLISPTRIRQLDIPWTKLWTAICACLQIYRLLLFLATLEMPSFINTSNARKSWIRSSKGFVIIAAKAISSRAAWTMWLFCWFPLIAWNCIYSLRPRRVDPSALR